MKKFIKWFLFAIVLCGGIALAICYITIPERTKQAVDIVIGYADKPLFIIGGSTITIGMVAYFVLSTVLKTSRDKMKEDFNDCVKELESQKNKVELQFKQKSEEFDQKYKEFVEKVNSELEKYGLSIEAIEQVANENRDLIKLIPNKKIQEKVESYVQREEVVND